jgi:hypothetical protein
MYVTEAHANETTGDDAMEDANLELYLETFDLFLALGIGHYFTSGPGSKEYLDWWTASRSPEKKILSILQEYDLIRASHLEKGNKIGDNLVCMTILYMFVCCVCFCRKSTE